MQANYMIRFVWSFYCPQQYAEFLQLTTKHYLVGEIRVKLDEDNEVILPLLYYNVTTGKLANLSASQLLHL